jgi:D-alanyl-lipoteichoic acid acyltransferase DltB (MBOAT superfamily)
MSISGSDWSPISRLPAFVHTLGSSPQTDVADVRASAVAPAESRLSIAGLAAVCLQLGLLALVIQQFEIESAAFAQLAMLTFGGFVVHSLLPLQHRLAFFLLLSVAGISLVLGVRDGVFLVVCGLGLVAICHLPAPFIARVSALGLVAAALALVRAEWISIPFPDAIWPILGSMFMFRLAVYLYDLKHDKEPPNAARTLSYFFMLPNVCFPLFPVIDFKTFRRTYYNEEAYHIYQNGIRWMFRGIVHLVLYRLVYYHLTISPAEVADVPDLVRYLTSNFLLYLRVSGQFHLIVGMLHLFGFNLPPTHYLFYLASSFNDFWRRINIYWKDFMMKLFYYPAYFKLRRLGNTSALVLSTLFVFGSTWLLHSYQWFWLRGSFPLNWQDGVFWGLLAILVVVNSLHEAKHGRSRNLGKRSWTLGSLAGLSLRTAGTFCMICVLWSVWTSESFEEWLSLWSLPGGWGAIDPGSLVSVLLLGMVWFGWSSGGPPSDGRHEPSGPLTHSRFWCSSVVTSLSIAALYAVGHPAVYSKLGAHGELVGSVRSAQLNAQDATRLEAGYYEGLLRVDRFNSQLWEVYMRNPDAEAAWDASDRIVKWPEDFRLRGLQPNMQIQFRGSPYSTNRWGMRDRDYERVKSPGTTRVGFLGSSVVMGAGVGNGENFESLLEQRFVGENGEKSYEFLNFAVSQYGPVEQVAVAELAFEFDVDVLIIIAHHHDAQRAVSHLARVATRGVPIPYEQLASIASRAGVRAGMRQEEGERLLRPFAEKIVASANHEIVRLSLQRGVRPIWVFMPVLHDQRDDGRRLAELAGAAGFAETIDLTEIFHGRDKRELRISEGDTHPNAAGHRLLAEHLYTHFSAGSLLNAPRRTAAVY